MPSLAEMLRESEPSMLEALRAGRLRRRMTAPPEPEFAHSCPSFVTMGGARLWCMLYPPHDTHRHFEIAWHEAQHATTLAALPSAE
jgi:hypothetical protein